MALCKCSLSPYEELLLKDDALGQISFKLSSSDADVRCHFEIGLKCLHNFIYDVALEQFRRVQELDKNCAMAYWGEAMCSRMPLWNVTNDKLAHDALDRISGEEGCNTVELGLIKSCKVLFDKTMSQTERDCKYLQELKSLHDENPQDLDVASFYALALMVVSSQESCDNAIELWEECATCLEDAYTNAPGGKHHPGILHFLCHVFDHPDQEIAIRGTTAAREYGKIGKLASHALHMPSHIFLRLGEWELCAESNKASIEASDKLASLRGRDITNDFGNLYHSLEYLASDYANLGRFEESDNCVERMDYSLFRRSTQLDETILKFEGEAKVMETRECVKNPRRRRVGRKNTEKTDVPGGASCHNKGGKGPIVPSTRMFLHYMVRMKARQVLNRGRWDRSASPQEPLTDAAVEPDFYLSEAGGLFVAALGKLLDSQKGSPFSEQEWQDARKERNMFSTRHLSRSGITAFAVTSICKRLDDLTKSCQDHGAVYSALATRSVREQIEAVALFVSNCDWESAIRRACATQDEMTKEFLATSPTLLYVNSYELYGQLATVTAMRCQAKRQELGNLAVSCFDKVDLASKRPSCLLGKARAYRIMGQEDDAKTQYKLLIDMWHQADEGTPSLVEAQTFLTSCFDSDATTSCDDFTNIIIGTYKSCSYFQ